MAYIPVDIDNAVKKECKRRRFSPRTTQTYLFCINKFLEDTKKPLQYISKKDVREFLEDLAEKERAGSTMNVYHMAIKFFFEQVLDKRMWVNIKYSKTPKKLPVVLTKEEVKKLIESISNSKHKLMIAFMYSAGLRVSELINLKIKDLELEKGFGYIRKGKGGKDRIFVVAEKLAPILQQLITTEILGKEDYLFTSKLKRKYTAASLQKIIKDATKKAKISKKVHCHTLRHSFATHLIDNGYAITDVQAVLGHKNPETSMIYIHSSNRKMINIKSPLDNL